MSPNANYEYALKKAEQKMQQDELPKPLKTNTFRGYYNDNNHDDINNTSNNYPRYNNSDNDNNVDNDTNNDNTD